MFRTILVELFLPFRPFKRTANIRWTTISKQILNETQTRNGGLLLREKKARQLIACLNLKSLKNVVCCWLMPGSNNEVLGITNDFLYPNNCKTYDKEVQNKETSL